MQKTTNPKVQKMNRSVIQTQSLSNAINGASSMNYGAIFDGFAELGIPLADIRPRENVFTFNAWKGLKRVVRKGQHGVKVCTYVQTERVDRSTGEITANRMPRTTTVFHISQTEPLEHHPQGSTVEEPAQA